MMMTHGLPYPVQTADRDFPNDFKTYVKEKDLLFQHGIEDSWWVFWSRENHRCDRPPPCSEIFDLGSETRIAATNPELITHSIKTVIEKIVGRWSDVLVQFWIAIKIGGGRTLLTTRDQPFGIRDGFRGYDGLCRYRLIFKDYEIYVDDDDDGESDEDNLGLPGRVFRHQRPESTPDVRFYSCKEYLERDRVVNINNVRECFAVPVLEPSGQCCVGVLEVVSINFASNLAGAIRTSFEAVGPRSLKVYVPLSCLHKGDEKVQKAFAEIKEVLERVYTHELPLALTWGPCRNCNQAFIHDKHLFYNPDASGDCFLNSFSSACNVHPLGKGEGVAGTAFSSHNSAFCRDITQFSITKYPLAHHARRFGLTGCFAICLRSSYTGNDVYVLEFFLAPSKTKGEDPRITLVPLLTKMKQHFQSFTVASGKELGEELPLEVIDFSKDGKLVSSPISLTARSHRIENGGEMEWLDLCDQQLVGVDAINTGNNVDSNTQINNNIVVTHTEPQSMAMQDTSIVTIKAKYGNDYIRFQLSVSSGMVEFQQQVAKRLENLQPGTYRVEYQDEDNDWILIACDEDLQNYICNSRNYICNSRSLGRNTVKMSIRPITNCPP